MIKFLSFILFLFLLLITTNIPSSFENISNNTVKNFTYKLLYSNQTAIFIKGKFESKLRSRNERDLEKYLKAEIVNFIIVDFYPRKVAFVVIRENMGGSAPFYELTALVQSEDGIIQTNSIELGDRIEVKKLEFAKGFILPFGSMRSKLLVTLLAHKEADDSCCSTNEIKKCFTIVSIDKNKYMLMTCEEADKKYPLPIVKKPAVYLYPEKPQKVEVKLDPIGTLTKTIPKYKGKWIVTALPNGTIDGKYFYLFYEVALQNQVKLHNFGWVVEGDKIIGWFKEYLPKLGLNEKERNDFIEYWERELPDCNYYEVRLLDEDFLSKNLKIEINPKPDILIRRIFHFKCIDEKKLELLVPHIITPQRKGFTVVEWGGIVDMNEASLSAQRNERKEGVIVKDGYLIIRVESGGCTGKKDIKHYVTKEEIMKENKKLTRYTITFSKFNYDRCKAFFPNGVPIKYLLKEELGIDTSKPFELKIKNLACPIFSVINCEKTIISNEVNEDNEKVRLR